MISGRTFPAVIEVIADGLDPVSRTAKVRASIANPGRELKNEMLVSAEVDSSTDRGVEVPSKTVFFLGDRHYAYAQVDTHTFERREVQLGASHEQSVQVLQGLEPGERVVSDGVLLLEQIWIQHGPSNPGAPSAGAAGI